MRLDKQRLLEVWREHLQSRLAELTAAQDAATAGTRVDGTHRPENRGERGAVTTQGYLAGALGERVAELTTALQALGAIGAGPRRRVGLGAAFVVGGEGGATATYAILPGAQGDSLEVDGLNVVVVSPRAPVAAALAGRQEGDEAVLERRGRDEELELLAVW
jgi:transcription elongation GreA/GreB family factor